MIFNTVHEQRVRFHNCNTLVLATIEFYATLLRENTIILDCKLSTDRLNDEWLCCQLSNMSNIIQCQLSNGQ